MRRLAPEYCMQILRRQGGGGTAHPSPRAARAGVALLLAAAGCRGSSDAPTGLSANVAARCAPSAVSPGIAQTARVDCSNGGMRVQLAGSGASYLVVAQFATSQGSLQFVPYSLSVDTSAAAASADRAGTGPRAGAMGAAGAPPARSFDPARQDAADALLRARARVLAAAGAFAATARLAARSGRATRSAAAAVNPPPPVGSIRSFHVLSNFDPAAPAWQRVGAQLDYVGSNILLYVDTLAPAGGFTAGQLTQLSQYFDQALYPIDSAAFGQPSDIDDNGRVIMLLSPVVNGDTPAGSCAVDGYIAGFFDSEDFSGPSDTASNQGEIFYSIVPDPNGLFSCPHSASSVSSIIPATFLHELQHLINFSQHVIVSGGQPASSWLDEGMSIVAEELGSLQYEVRVPAAAVPHQSAAVFPGFV